MTDINSEITELLAQAMRAIQFGHKQAAAAYLNRILEVDPENMDAWRWLAECMPNQAKRDYCLERAGLLGNGAQPRVSSGRNAYYATNPALTDIEDDEAEPTLAEQHARKAALRGQKKAELPPHYHTALSIDLDRPKATSRNSRNSQSQARPAQQPRPAQRNTVVPLARKPIRKRRKPVSFKGLGCSILVISALTLLGYGLFSTGLTTGSKAWHWLSTQIENNTPLVLSDSGSTEQAPSAAPVNRDSVLATYFPTPVSTPTPDTQNPAAVETEEVDTREAAEAPVSDAPVADTPSETNPVEAGPASAVPATQANDNSIVDDSPATDSGVDSNTVTFDSPANPPAPAEQAQTASDQQAAPADTSAAANEPAVQNVAAEPAPAVAGVSAQPTGYVNGPIVIGKSVKGNNIEVMQFGNGPVERMMVAGVHGGNEWNTTALADQLIAYIQKNPDVIPGDRTLYILRLLNPDGEERGHNLDGRTNERGVDLNRNWDAFWVVDWPRDGCWNYRPISAGSEPFSEPEAAALRDFITAHKISALVNYHSAAMGIFAGGNPPEAESIHLAQSIAAVTDYAYPPLSTGCKYTGQFADWLAMHGTAAVDLELTNHTDTDFDANLKVLNTLLKWEPISGQKSLTGLIKMAENQPEKPSIIEQIRKFGVQTTNQLNGLIFGQQEEK